MISDRRLSLVERPFTSIHSDRYLHVCWFHNSVPYRSYAAQQRVLKLRTQSIELSST